MIEAWHGTKGDWGGVFGNETAWFSTERGISEAYAESAVDEGLLPTLYRVEVDIEYDDLFHASRLEDDEEFREEFIECLIAQGESRSYIEQYILPAIEAFSYGELNYEAPSVYECIEAMGYKGWWEKEKHRFHNDTINFGIFNPGQYVTTVETILTCPECRYCELEKQEDDELLCDSCQVLVKYCDDCQQQMTYVEDDGQWTCEGDWCKD